MNKVEALLHRLNTEDPSAEIRDAIIDLITETLRATKSQFEYWEKAHLADAIRAVDWNLKWGPEPRRAWLTMALVALEKVTVPAEQRNEFYTKKIPAVDSLRYEHFVEALKQWGANAS